MSGAFTVTTVRPSSKCTLEPRRQPVPAGRRAGSPRRRVAVRGRHHEVHLFGVHRDHDRRGAGVGRDRLGRGPSTCRSARPRSCRARATISPPGPRRGAAIVAAPGGRIVVTARLHRDERRTGFWGDSSPRYVSGFVVSFDGRRARDLPGSRRGGLHAEQLADHVLGVGVVTFAEVRVPNVAGAVGDVVGGPVLVPERVPDRHVVVERDRPRDVIALHSRLYVGVHLLEVELRRMHADDRRDRRPRYRSNQERRYGNVRWQLMHE